MSGKQLIPRENRRRVCVVGAGPAGLTATKTLKQAGHHVTCFEQSSVVGGHWVLNNPNGCSSAYDSLTTNTTKQMSRFSDFEMPADWPQLPTHAHMAQWFANYAAAFNLQESIHLSHRVVAAQPQPVAGWLVTVEHNHEQRVLEFDALVAASGNYWLPKMPSFDGEFKGVVLHAQSYRSPNKPLDVRGKSVVVVGIGNTGCELALEVSRAGAKQVLLSARSGTWIIPKYIEEPEGRTLMASQSPMSHPDDHIPAVLRYLPRRSREWLFERIAASAMQKRFSKSVAQLQRLGLPNAPNHPLDKRPTVADDLNGALERGDIKARGGITQLDGYQVTFDEQRAEDADVILCATGYHLSYPFLANDVLATDNDDMRLYQGLMHPHRHDLFVVGVSRPTGGFWPIAEIQSRFIGELLAGRYVLPNQANIDRDSGWVMRRRAFNPALYGLALNEELARGARRSH